MSPLSTLLHYWAGTPFEWGRSDCALALADWYRVLHGRDPAAHLRGQYFDALSCQRLCGWMTDPVRVVEECLATVGGLPRVAEPRTGDVGVIDWPLEGRTCPVGAIWFTDCWAVRGCDETRGGLGASTIHAQMVAPRAIWGMGYEA